MALVLILEDNDLVQGMYQRILESYDIDLAMTSTVADARAFLETGEVPSIIVFDYEVEDGFTPEFVRSARGLLPNTIMIATSADLSAHQKLLDAGCDRVAEKNRVCGDIISILALPLRMK